MTPERWQLIKEVFRKIEDCASAEQSLLLEDLCRNDAELRRQVEEILCETLDGAFIEQVIQEEAANITENAAVPERFGSYQVMGRIGKGGMGTVYEAVRTDDFRKRVALKVIQQDIDSDIARERFQHERQVLAELEHPYIARLLDGGETSDGSPFLVLEYVDGETIDASCVKLDRAGRLRLFLKVCDAVQYAHSKLVVHRDLKPANILVTSAGEPKLLDFGIAKLLDVNAAKTRTGFSALTPEYASPEQVRGETISTSSDVYSLGIVLYQILTDRKPYTLDTGAAIELERVICQQPPAPPGLGDELDHILLMALRKEPDRRYSSVQRFAEDIERYLDHRPVSARPDTIRYRCQKFVRRNWWQITAVATVVVSLTAGLGFSLAAERQANRRFTQLRQLTNRFLFDFHDEIVKTPGTVKAREMIVSTALEYLNSLAAEAAGDPGLQWELAEAYGRVAAVQGSTVSPSLGRTLDAADSYEKAFALERRLDDRRQLSPTQRAAFVKLLLQGAQDQHGIRRDGQMLLLCREAVTRSAGLSGKVRLDALNQLASALVNTGDLLGALDARQRVMPQMREAAERDPSYENRRDLAKAIVNLGYVKARLSRFDEALADERDALSRYTALEKEHKSDAAYFARTKAVILGYMAQILGAGDRISMERYREAAQTFEDAIAALAPILAADAHDKGTRFNVGTIRANMAYALQYVAPVEASQQAAKAISIVDETSQDFDVRAQCRIIAANAERASGNLERAEALLEEAVDIVGGRHALVVADLNRAWGKLDAARGDATSAANRFEKAIEIYEKELASAATPSNAWVLTQTLQFAAAAVPSDAVSRRRRILDVWVDQDRRYPRSPYIEKQLAAARLAVASQ